MSKRPNHPIDGHDVIPDMMQQLEPRTLFSSPHDFAGVGIRFDGGPTVFMVEGQIAEDDTMTGAMRSATLAGGVSDSGLDWTRYVRGERGALSFETRDGFAAYAAQSGMQFIREDRWTLGSFMGMDANENVRDWAVLSEVATPTGDLRDWVLDNFQLQMTRLTESGLETLTLTVNTHRQTTNAETFTFTYALPGGDVSVTKDVASVTGTRITFTSGEVMFLAGDNGGEGVLLADFDNSDGIMGVASGRQTDGTATGTRVNGVYTGTILTSGPESRAFLGAAEDAPAADVVIQFRWHGQDVPGTFFVYNRAAWDQGDRAPVNSGTWTVQVNTGSPSHYFVQMTDTSDRVVIARPSPTTRGVWLDELNTPTDAREQFAGVLEAQELRAGNIQEVLAEVDADGRPIAYMQIGQFGDDEGDEGIFSVDLLDEVGGEAVVGRLFVWGGLGDTFIAGVSADGDVQMWRWTEYGWIYQNLTETVPGAVPLATHFTGSVYETGSGNSGFQTLVGFDAEGDFVAYRQVSASPLHQSAWVIDDSEVQGLAGGPLPTSVTQLAGYGTTNWNGQNFAGLDDQGQLWAVWWAPGLTQWQVTNMTAQYAIETFTGNVSALHTDWSTLHIIGTSAADGHLVVVWWAPGFDSWISEDLTETVNGPVLEAGTLAAHFSHDLRTINFAGKDLDGNVRDYWWAPYAPWSVATLAPAESEMPDTPWQFTSSWWLATLGPEFTRAHSQSLLGRTKDGHLVRLVWSDTRADAWLYEDVTAVSFSYFT